LELILLNVPDTIEPRQFHNLLSFVSKEKQVRIMKFLKDIDKYRTLLADILIRQFIIKTININNRDIEFLTNRYNKPFLKNNDALQFNISHAGNWIFLAVDSKEIGVDIEFIRPIDYSVINMVFSEKEKEYFQKLPDRIKLSTFYKIWTYKESFIKASGEGLSKDMKNYSLFPNQNDAILTLIDEKKLYFLKQYDEVPDYKLSVCALHNNFSKSLQFTTFETLYNETSTLS